MLPNDVGFSICSINIEQAENPTVIKPPDDTFSIISDLQLDSECSKRLLLDSANSLLEWNMFMGIRVEITNRFTKG